MVGGQLGRLELSVEIGTCAMEFLRVLFTRIEYSGL